MYASCPQCHNPIELLDDSTPANATCPICGYDGELDVGINLDGDSTLPMKYQQRGKYQLIRILAEGGMGRVWIARDSSIGRLVALKEVLQHLQNDELGRKRFLREVQITGRLGHPGVPSVHELCSVAGETTFYTMDLISGRTISDLTRNGWQRDKRLWRLQLTKLLQSFISICQTIAYANARGVIHRDLKGQNVIVGDFGQTYVLDWGLAKILPNRGLNIDIENPPVFQAHELAEDASLVGSVLGSPSYMAPEQAMGLSDQITARTDVYGLGAILYEILTGRPPIREASLEETLRKAMLGEIQRPKSINHLVPYSLQQVCLKALARNPIDRYSSATELAEDIFRWLNGKYVRAWRPGVVLRSLHWALQFEGYHPVTKFAKAVIVFPLLLAGYAALFSFALAISGNPLFSLVDRVPGAIGVFIMFVCVMAIAGLCAIPLYAIYYLITREQFLR